MEPQWIRISTILLGEKKMALGIINVLGNSAMRKLVNMAGESIVVKPYTISRDSNDDTTKTYTSSTTMSAVLEPVDESYADEDFGYVTSGDLIAYVEGDETIPDPKQTDVNARSMTWKLVGVHEWKPNGGLVYTGLLLRLFDSRT